jgi:hypothetical protein
MVMVSKERSWVVWVVGGAFVLALLGGAYYASRTHSASPPPVANVSYSGMLEIDPPGAAPLSVTQSGTHEPQRPADIDAIEWQKMVDGLHNHPQRDQELKRMVGYLRFKRDLDRWTAMKDQPNALERAQVGQKILDALPVRFANQDVTAPEALTLQAAIYADMIPDEAQRRPLENAARQALMRQLEHDSAMQAKLEAEDSQTAGFKAREAEIMKKFKDQLIDQSQMEKELDAARVASYK